MCGNYDIFAKRTIPSGSAQLTYTSVQCVLLRESHVRKIAGMSDQKLEDLTCSIDNFKAEIHSELVELNKRLLTVETLDLREKRQVQTDLCDHDDAGHGNSVGQSCLTDIGFGSIDSDSPKEIPLSKGHISGCASLG